VKPLHICLEGFFSTAPYDRTPGLVCQFGKLRSRVATFLEIKVSTVIESFDDHFLPAPAGEEDEGDGAKIPAHQFQKFDPVHIGHLVIGNNGIKFF